MPAGQLGWDKLFSEIRGRARREVIYVYDAACGFGGIGYELIKDRGSKNLVYVGADIHNALREIHKTLSFAKYNIFLMRWDISNVVPLKEKFDYVICRASLHHTPNPEKAFAAICSSLKPQGTVAISVYNKKSICREVLDDSLRSLISPMPWEEAFEVCREFTILAKSLQQIKEKFRIDEDLPLLGITKGEMFVQELIYYHFLKCFYNEEFGDELSTLVNYDWYHPAYAFRYEIDEVKSWFSANGIKITETDSIPAQHYLRGIKTMS
jgi:SAM-dependent methyltransferase